MYVVGTICQIRTCLLVHLYLRVRDPTLQTLDIVNQVQGKPTYTSAWESKDKVLGMAVIFVFDGGSM